MNMLTAPALSPDLPLEAWEAALSHSVIGFAELVRPWAGGAEKEWDARVEKCTTPADWTDLLGAVWLVAVRNGAFGEDDVETYDLEQVA